MQVKSVIAFVFFITCILQAKEPEVYFSATTDLAKKYMEYVGQEEQSIRVVSYRLSDVKIITSLIQAHRRGVSVEVIVDPKSLTKHSKLRLLVEEGGEVFVWKGKDRMHHAFCLFGQDLVWTGSYTFSLQTRFQHREGAVILSDLKSGKKFFEEFARIKRENTVPFLDYLKSI